MKKISMVLMLAMASVLLFTTSCGGSLSPGDLSVKMVKDIEAGDIEALKAAFYNDGKELSEEEDQKLSAMVQYSVDDMKKKGGLKSVEVVKEEINDEGTEAVVKLKVIYNNDIEDTQIYDYEKINGGWQYVMKFN